jgi:hypothetical protein
MAVNMRINFWNATSYSLVRRYNPFGGSYMSSCNLKTEWKQQVPLKRRYPSTNLIGDLSEKRAIYS